jgi:hypothetical protein
MTFSSGPFRNLDEDDDVGHCETLDGTPLALAAVGKERKGVFFD